MRQPHNEYFEAASETGLLGIAALIGVVVFGLVQSVSRTGLPSIVSAGLFVSILASAMDAFFLFPWQISESALVFWVLLGIVSGQTRISQEAVLEGATLEPELP
jgi:O-antigen ligase